jgi:hypothetical protein
MLLALVIVGLVSGLGIEGEKRRARFHELALMHRNKALQHSAFGCSGSEERQAKAYDAHLKEVGPFMAYHTKLSEKYKRAAWFPWFPVDHDPPALNCCR